MELFYFKNLKKKDKELKFPLSESKHLFRVLRKKIGDSVIVTNGIGLEWIGKIQSINPTQVTLENISVKLHNRNTSAIHIAISPIKNNNRMELFVEKATEIGISEITPIICDHSEKKSVNKERFNKILIGSIKQSSQFFIPKLNPIISFNKFIEEYNNKNLLIAHCRKGKKKRLHQIDNIDNEIFVLIGPEGDFSETEIKLARKKSLSEISLGKNRLRTETAGIHVCSAIHTLRNIKF